MSTATMRLRRAGAGGLAAAVVAGMVVASAGIACRSGNAGRGYVPLTATSAATTIYPGLANQAAGDVEYWIGQQLDDRGDPEVHRRLERLQHRDHATANAVSLQRDARRSPWPARSSRPPVPPAPRQADLQHALSSTVAAGGRATLAGVKDVAHDHLQPAGQPGTTADVFSVTLGGIKYTTGSTAPRHRQPRRCGHRRADRTRLRPQSSTPPWRTPSSPAASVCLSAGRRPDRGRTEQHDGRLTWARPTSPARSRSPLSGGVPSPRGRRRPGRPGWVHEDRDRRAPPR